MTTTAAILAAITTIGFQASGAMSDASYCSKVRARATADAALLLAPRLFAQFLRYPLGVDLGPTENNNFQLRVGLSFSPIDGYRGLKLMGISEADCRAFGSRNRASRLVEDAIEGLVANASRAETLYLEARRGEWRALLRQAQQRLDAHIITVVEFEEFARRLAVLDHKLEEARTRVARYDARGAPPLTDGLATLERAYIDDQRELENRSSKLRRIDDWNFRVVGGAIPSLDQRVGWFGWIEASYNLGGLFQGPQENTYLRMRAAEIQEAPYEYPERLRALRREARAMLDHAERELSMASEHLALLDRTRNLLAAAGTSAASQELDLVAVEHMLATGDQVRWSALINQLVAFLEDKGRGSSHE
jgi:hypothetical protein